MWQIQFLHQLDTRSFPLHSDIPKASFVLYFVLKHFHVFHFKYVRGNQGMNYCTNVDNIFKS